MHTTAFDAALLAMPLLQEWLAFFGVHLEHAPVLHPVWHNEAVDKEIGSFKDGFLRFWRWIDFLTSSKSERTIDDDLSCSSLLGPLEFTCRAKIASRIPVVARLL